MLASVILGFAVALMSPMLWAVEATDSDDDLMPDAYENSYAFLDPQNPSDAALDQDGDGYSNLEEYIVGTAPDSAASKPGDVLLIDDDLPGFSALSAYTDALDQLGVTYDVITTEADDIPVELAAHREYPNIYNKIIWFGHTWMGPTQEAETALAATLDAGKCLILNSQDYFYHREAKTAFMDEYLGVDSIVGDIAIDKGSDTVTGAGRFSELGPYSLTYPYGDYSDAVTPDSTAFTGFIGDNGGTSIFKDSGVYRTGFLTFQLEAITLVDRAEAIEALLDYCDTGHLPVSDFDGDGTPDVDDPDDDNDGLPDTYEESHAFLDPFNASDATLDQDGDSLTNLQEYLAGTDPTKADTDNDGLPDSYEASHAFLNPLKTSDAALDQDNDELTNLQEYLAGSDPTKKDTDNDGLSDKYEFDNQLDPADGVCPTWVCGGGSWRHAISLIK